MVEDLHAAAIFRSFLFRALRRGHHRNRAFRAARTHGQVIGIKQNAAKSGQGDEGNDQGDHLAAPGRTGKTGVAIQVVGIHLIGTLVRAEVVFRPLRIGSRSSARTSALRATLIAIQKRLWRLSSGKVRVVVALSCHQRISSTGSTP